MPLNQFAHFIRKYVQIWRICIPAMHCKIYVLYINKADGNRESSRNNTKKKYEILNIISNAIEGVF